MINQASQFSKSSTEKDYSSIVFRIQYASPIYPFEQAISPIHLTFERIFGKY